MTQRKAETRILNSQVELVHLIYGDKVQVWLPKQNSPKFLIYGLEIIKDIGAKTTLSLIEPSENFAVDNTIYLWKSNLTFLTFENGIRYDPMFFRYFALSKDSPEFEKAKGLVELLNK